MEAESDYARADRSHGAGMAAAFSRMQRGVQVLMAGRAAARQRQLNVRQLVVDEAIVLRGPYARRPPLFRAKGGVHYPRRSSCHVFVRLREVPGAVMKTVVLRPWWERRLKHHRPPRKGSRGWITSRSEFAAVVDAAPATAGA